MQECRNIYESSNHYWFHRTVQIICIRLVVFYNPYRLFNAKSCFYILDIYNIYEYFVGNNF